MFDDITYLNILVSPDEPWEVLIKQLRTRKITGAELKKRIAHTVVNGLLGRIGENKGGMWLSVGDTFATYNSEDWVAKYEQIKEYDSKIVSIRKKLSCIDYLSPELVQAYAPALWVLHTLQSEWKLSLEDACAEISLYGEQIFEQMFKARRSFIKKRGRYHLIRALQNFADENNIDLVRAKENISRKK